MVNINKIARPRSVLALLAYDTYLGTGFSPWAEIVRRSTGQVGCLSIHSRIQAETGIYIIYFEKYYIPRVTEERKNS